jgi:ribosomal protein S18 acetylase RimI-like enzyme
LLSSDSVAIAQPSRRFEAGRLPALRLVRQLAVTVAQDGIREALFWSAFSFLRVNRFVGFVRHADGPAAPAPAPADVRLAIWSAADMARWRARCPEAPTPCFRDRIDGVSRAAVVLAGDDLAALIWLYGPGDPSRMFRLGPGEAELNHGTVLPAFRRRGLFVAVLTHAVACLRAEGVRRVYAAVHDANHRSLRAFRAAGFAEFGRRTHWFVYRAPFPLAPERPGETRGSGFRQCCRRLFELGGRRTAPQAPRSADVP